MFQPSPSGIWLCPLEAEFSWDSEWKLSYSCVRYCKCTPSATGGCLEQFCLATVQYRAKAVFRIQSMTFCCGSGSANLCLWLMNPDTGSGSRSFFHRPSRWQQKTNLNKVFLLINFWRYIYIMFLKIKSPKEVTKQQESRFFLLFLLADKTIRSRSWRPKNMWIRWIRIRIRIQNIGLKTFYLSKGLWVKKAI